MPISQPVPVRTLFISDVHLGTRGCQADLLMDFLRHHPAEMLYLVGDIVEGRRLLSRRVWPAAQRAVVEMLLQVARNGTRVVYVPGNHDALFRRCAGGCFGGIEIAVRALHAGTDGQRYLVTHGDQFDVVQRRMPWLATVGHGAYHALLASNTGLNRMRRGLGLDYWSLSAWAKRRVKQAVNYISSFEEALSAEARRHKAQGVVCGHIHHAADRDLDGIRYLNTGDWVESCTGVVEHADGRFEVVQWAAPRVSPIATAACWLVDERSQEPAAVEAPITRDGRW